MKKISPFSAFPPRLKTIDPEGLVACPDCDLLLKDAKEREGGGAGPKKQLPTLRQCPLFPQEKQC